MAHSDEIKATAIALFEAERAHTSEDLAARRVSKALLETYKKKVSIRSIKRWASGEHVSTEATEDASAKKQILADLFEDLARDALAGITPEKIKTASVAHLATIAGIAVDKMQLLRGEATSRNVEPQRAGSLWDHINRVSAEHANPNGQLPN